MNITSRLRETTGNFGLSIRLPFGRRNYENIDFFKENDLRSSNYRNKGLIVREYNFVNSRVTLMLPQGTFEAICLLQIGKTSTI